MRSSDISIDLSEAFEGVSRSADFNSRGQNFGAMAGSPRRPRDIDLVAKS